MRYSLVSYGDIGKFIRELHNVTNYVNDRGLTVVNALSTKFSMTTNRNTYRHTVKFEEGVKVDDIREDIGKGEKKHGTDVTFIPSKKFLGKNAELPFDKFVDWVDDMSYQVSPHITMEVEDFDGFERVFHQKYKAKPFGEYIKKVLVGKPICDPVILGGDEVLEEEVIESIIDSKDNVKQKKKKMKKDIHLDVVFAYEDDLTTVYNSFCNYTCTSDGGVHVDSVEEVICRFIQNKTKESMTEKEREKWDITWNDVKEGLKLCINLSTNAQVQFMGNAKSRIQNVELKPLLKKIVQEQLEEFATKNNDKMSTIYKFVKANARARVEADKTRKASKKSGISRLDEFMMDNYTPCNNTGKAYKELYLVEGGQSAGGAIVNGRKYPDFQAVFGFRGNTLNPFNHTFYQIMENVEWKQLVKVMRCGIGPTFDLSKLYFNKIKILTDADVDGFFITLGHLSFFVVYYPEIIEDGRLYKVFPPLYKIDDKKHPFVINNSELQEIFMKKLEKVYTIYTPGVGKMPKGEFFDLLFDTADYIDTLRDLTKYFKVESQLIEIVGSTLVELGIIRSETDFDDIPKALENQKIITPLMARVQEKYPEVLLKNNRLNGPMNGKFRSMELNNRLPKKIASLIDVYQDYGSILHVKENKGNECDMTLLEFLTKSMVYMPRKLQRYKGLGEGKPEEIMETIMNPDNQILIQFTMKDAEKALETFRKLQSGKKEYMKLRKEMMENYKVDISNIDT